MLASASYPEAADPVKGCAVSVIAYDTLPSLVTAQQEVANKGDKWQQRAHQHPHNSNNSIAALREGPQGCIFAAILYTAQTAQQQAADHSAQLGPGPEHACGRLHLPRATWMQQQGSNLGLQALRVG
jgi:hypothetical protein